MTRSLPPRKPEVLAPAGDPQSLQVALHSGADAVYFGLDEGFNARLRARNFPLDTLPETVARVHRAGSRAYLTLNTLVFEAELEEAERLITAAARAGIDALIVQDPAVALLARRISPDLHLHASTQMTISSAEAARFAETLGVCRVVAPRELSVTELRRLSEGIDLELEVFVVGALCVSWSGQCLSSEAWGGRSANRGQCAQACRLPYDLVVDGERRDLGDVAYLLSPRDLAGFRAISELVDMGVSTLKIEGRQKGPAYVHAATTSMRRWVDAAARGIQADDVARMQSDMRDLSLAYSRGFSDGWLAGSDHQTLVDGRHPAHRGVLLGRVLTVERDGVRVAPEPETVKGTGTVSSPLPALGGAPDAATGPAVAAVAPAAGMGVVFDEGRAEGEEEGGPIFEARREGTQWMLRFGRPGPDLRKVSRGARVWITSDPAVQSRAQRALKAPPLDGGIGITLQVKGQAGEPLIATAVMRGSHLSASSETPLQAARGAGLDEAMLRDKLGSFGGTPFRLEALHLDALDAGLFVPVGELKQMRRALVAALEARLAAAGSRTVDGGPHVEALRTSLAPALTPSVTTRIAALCRSDEQLEAVIESGLDEVTLDYMEMVGLGKAVARARRAGLKVCIATVRVQKPGEESYDRRIASLRPDAVLVRHWAGVMHFSRQAERPQIHGDFSLNVTNSITASHLLGLGLDTLTASHDLDETQLMALLDHVPASRFAVAVHHHIPTFHTEHCVYANTLSEGRDFRTCGRPCEAHQVSLRDRVGLEHPVIVDVGCRNTVFNALAQSAASLVPALVSRGVALLRVEFVRERRDEAKCVLETYQALLRGDIAPAEAVRRVGVHEQFGVTRGTTQTRG